MQGAPIDYWASTSRLTWFTAYSISPLSTLTTVRYRCAPGLERPKSTCLAPCLTRSTDLSYMSDATDSERCLSIFYVIPLFLSTGNLDCKMVTD